MPRPQSGSAGNAVSPAEPQVAEDADVTDPGEVSSHSRGSESEQASPHRPDEYKTGWIEIELVDENDQPISGERYEITTPDGSVASGTLDQNGFARVEGMDSGTCQVSFPNLDRDVWEKI